MIEFGLIQHLNLASKKGEGKQRLQFAKSCKRGVIGTFKLEVGIFGKKKGE